MSALPKAEAPLTWTQTVHGMLDVYVAECGAYDFEIRTTPDMGYRLRMWQIRPDDSPLMFWQMDGYSLEEAKTRAAQMAAQRVPPIVRRPQP